MSYSSRTLTDSLPPVRWLFGPSGPIAMSMLRHEKPWLRVLISHGFTEHRGWWAETAAALHAQGITVGWMDHYHHGLSTGRPNDLPGIHILTQSLRAAVLAMESTGQGGRTRGSAGEGADAGQAPPLVLLGHSQGALAVLHTLHRHPELAPAGLVLASPLLGLGRKTVVYGRVLSALLRFAPRLRVRTQTNPRRLTTDSTLWPRYLADPLRKTGVTRRYFHAMIAGIAKARAEMTHLSAPLLLLEAGDERVVSSRAIGQWFEAAVAPEKSRRQYPGMRHELFNDVGREQVLADVLNWARAHFGGGSTGSGNPPGGNPAAGSTGRVA